MEETLKRTIVADLESHCLNLAANIRLHFFVAASLRNCDISCVVKWRRRSCLRICRECFRVARWEFVAILTFHWAIGQMPKPRASTRHHSCDLRLHLGEGLEIISCPPFIGPFLVAGTIIPVHEAMKVGQVADVEALPFNLSPDEERHLVMATELGSLLVPFFVKSSNGAGCEAGEFLKMGADLTSILVAD